MPAESNTKILILKFTQTKFSVIPFQALDNTIFSLTILTNSDQPNFLWVRISEIFTSRNPQVAKV